MSQPAPPETTRIASIWQSRLYSQQADSSAVSLLRWITPASHGRRLANQSACYSKSFIQHPIDLQPPSCCKEDYKQGCCKEKRQVCQLASRYEDSFAHHPTGELDS
jgi:hypothetical protein